MKKIILSLLMTFLIFSGTNLTAQNSWPREIPIKNGGKVTIYQPQPEKLSGNKLTGRSAVSVKKTAKDEPVFGAFFFEAMLITDKSSRTAEIETVKITRAKFPGIDDTTKVKQFNDLLATEVTKWKLTTNLDELIATIEKENIASGNDKFNTDPPKIIYKNKPSTLVLIDGEPKIKEEKEAKVERVVNTPFVIFNDGDQWNLYAGGIWYKSHSITSGWEQNKKLSKTVKSVDEQIKKQEKENNNGKENTEKPQVTEIVVSTEPAELLQTKGEAEFKNITGTSLLYASNSPNQIFKDINSQLTYILLAGRWYSSSSLNGPWTYVAADKLPADFAKIPEGSEKDAVLASVAGTTAAEEAKIDASIPQTAKVDKKTATVKVEYDGSPKFKKIEGTSLQLAENANVTVLKDDKGKYYAVENGVWFMSEKATGPWSVSDERPKDVENIPPESEAYNTKYVYVYETTPQYVYVGYTPGYMGCYIYGPTIIYGTGYYYAPWYGAMYYPHPVTWGFGFSYNPWTGWSMSIGFSYGFMSVGFHFGGYPYGGYWGCPAYRPPYYRPPYYGGGYYGNRVNHYGNTNINIDNSNNINIDGGGRGNNIYKDRPGVDTRDAKRGSNNNTNRGNYANKANTNNNVFADRNGDVYQKDNKGNWNQRDNKSNQWKSAGNNNNVSNLNQQSQMRDRGTQRSSNFNNYNRPSTSGRSMGGGGGRRR